MAFRWQALFFAPTYSDVEKVFCNKTVDRAIISYSQMCFAPRSLQRYAHGAVVQYHLRRTNTPGGRGTIERGMNLKVGQGVA